MVYQMSLSVTSWDRMMSIMPRSLAGWLTPLPNTTLGLISNKPIWWLFCNYTLIYLIRLRQMPFHEKHSVLLLLLVVCRTRNNVHRQLFILSRSDRGTVADLLKSLGLDGGNPTTNITFQLHLTHIISSTEFYPKVHSNPIFLFSAILQDQL